MQKKKVHKTYADTPATGFGENGRITAVKTDKGTIKTNKVVVASSIWVHWLERWQMFQSHDAC